jgi:hypothetical protein
MKIDHFPDGQFSFMKADALLYWIDIESKSKGFRNMSIENRIESKPIRFDSPGKINRLPLKYIWKILQVDRVLFLCLLYFFVLLNIQFTVEMD